MSNQDKKVSKIESHLRVEKLIEETDLGKSCSNLAEWKKSITEIHAYNIADSLSDYLKLISNPIRIKIILILLEREWACNCEFEHAFEMHQALISHHLKLLRDGKIITYSKSGSWKYYKIREEIRPFIEQMRDLLVESIQHISKE
jgi:ArsR family transcriptional regulator